MTKPKLLIVDDDEAIRTQLKYALRDDFVLFFADNRPNAVAALQENHPNVVTLDLGLPPAAGAADEGLRTLDEIMRLAPRTKVVVVTGNGDRENAYRALQLGAVDYCAKPIDASSLKVVLGRASFLQGLEVESERRLKIQETSNRFEDILGNTPAMREIFAIVTRVSKTDATVLVQGESGTGKELLARAIHSRSPRRSKPFVAINCGAIPDTLLEPELFGHEKGAYTGAHVQRKGKLELADNGTVFLDEIGEMGLPLQVKLLRFLQERQIERVGGRQTIGVDVRVIAATNKELKAELRAARFREDLYYRLSVVNLRLPPLRERGEDIVLIANALLRRSAQEHRRNVRFSSQALAAMARYPWPGNVRELENTVQRAVIMVRGQFIETSDLGIEVEPPADGVPSLREARGRADREALVEALIKTRGNISRAAEDLDISRPTIHGLLGKFGVNAREFR